MNNKVFDKLMPYVTKFTNMPFVSALNSGMVSAMPFLVDGSIGLIIKSLPFAAWTEFLKTPFAGITIGDTLGVWSTATFDLFTLISIICIAYYYAEQLQVNKLFASVLTVVGFALVTPLSVIVGDVTTAAIPLRWLGAQGLFVGMIVAFVSVKIYEVCLKNNIVIKMPESVPSNVVTAFGAMVPIFFVMVLGFITRFGVILIGYSSFHELIQKILAAPLIGLGGSLPGVLISVFLMSFFWVFGIHGSAIVTGVMNPIWLSIQAENLLLTEAGQPLTNMFTKTFVDFTKIGGTGFTLPLLLMFVFFSKSEQLKSLGKVSLVPGLFNINEPIIFGAPIVMNPILVVPFIITPIVATLVTYFAMNFGLVPYPTGVTLPWAMPGVIAGYLITNSVNGAILQVVLIAIGFLIYYPFFKVYDNKLFTEEQQKLSEIHD